MRHAYLPRDWPQGLSYGVDKRDPSGAARYGQKRGLEVLGSQGNPAGNLQPTMNAAFDAWHNNPPFDPALHDGNLWFNLGPDH